MVVAKLSLRKGERLITFLSFHFHFYFRFQISHVQDRPQWIRQSTAQHHTLDCTTKSRKAIKINDQAANIFHLKFWIFSHLNCVTSESRIVVACCMDFNVFWYFFILHPRLPISVGKSTAFTDPLYFSNTVDWWRQWNRNRKLLNGILLPGRILHVWNQASNILPHCNQCYCGSDKKVKIIISFR